MADDITPQQAQQIQALAAQVEVAYREITRSRTALSLLINAGRATCTDIKTYNLLAKSTYYYQKSMSDTIRGAGGQAPDITPPLYIAYQGRSGDDAVNIDCSQGGVNGWQPNGLGDFYVNPAHVEWRRGPTPSDNAAIAQTLGRVSFTNRPNVNPQLGYVGVIIAIVVAGIVLAVVGYIALKIAEVLGNLPQQVEYTKQMSITAEQHRATMEARARCLADCQAKGLDPIACNKSCAKVFTEYAPPDAPGGIGVLGWVLGGALVLGLGYLGWRFYQGRHLLMQGAEDGDEDGDNGDGEDDAIDADFIERVA